MDTLTPIFFVDTAGFLRELAGRDLAPATRAALASAASAAGPDDLLLVLPLRPPAELRTVTSGAASGDAVFAANPSAPIGRSGGFESARLRGTPAPPPLVARFAGWSIDLDSRRLTAASGAQRTLPVAEFRVLVALLQEPRRAIPREVLARRALGDRESHCPRTLDVYVSRLRRHLRSSRRLPTPIGTVRSIGYVLNADVEYVAGTH